MKNLNDESGQALVITALCMTCLLGFVGLAADVGVLLREKRLMQIAADSAAVSGAAELNYGNTSSAAQATATQNGFTNSVNGVTVSAHTQPIAGPHASNSNYVEVIISKSQPTIFMGLFGQGAMTINARAVATLGATNQCIYTLGSSGAGINITGNANIQLLTCGVVDDSSSNNALTLAGNSTLDAQSIGVVGGVSKGGSATINPTPVTGIVSTSDPLIFLPTPSIPNTCSANPNFGGGRRRLTPGCYTGLTVSGTVRLTLSPGLYVINGNLTLGPNVTLTGTGVTLDLLGTSTFPSITALNLRAPTSGTYNGVLIYQPSTNSNPVSLTVNSGSTLQGIVYAPNAAVSLTGNGGSNLYTDFVAQTLSLAGNASFNDYSSINGNSVLTTVKLVE